MALLVHLTSENNRNSLLRSGIKPKLYRSDYPKGVFAMPVTPDFYISYQWLRELKRSGQRTICGVYFRIPDEQDVYVGHYNQLHLHITVAEAAGIMMHTENAEGYEIFIPRKIEVSEIHRIRPLPQVLGWRYYPEAHSRKPCGCPVCQPRGEIKSQQIRQAWEEEMNRIEYRIKESSTLKLLSSSGLKSCKQYNRIEIYANASISVNVTQQVMKAA